MSLPEEHNEIIVFKQFDTAIDANLAKTKLDAYGIPCFLTDENVSTLYTAQSYTLFGVRLHIFQSDAERAAEILSDLSITESYTCPRCKSQDVHFEYSRSVASVFRTIVSLILVTNLPNKKVYRCQTCGHEF